MLLYPECIAPRVAAFTRAACILLYFSGSSELYVTVSRHHGLSNVWNNVVCAFHSSRVLFLDYFINQSARSMVGVVYLRADLWTLRTTTSKLGMTACQLINKLGIQRRPTKCGCRLVRQRYRPNDNINTTATVTETDLPFTTTPIPVIYPSRRRTTRSASRHLHLSTLLQFLGLHCYSVSTTRVTTIPSHRRPAGAFSMTTASSWCPSSLSPNDQSPHPTQATDDPACSTTTHHRHHNSKLYAVPSAGRHSACPTTSRLVLGALNVRSLNNKVDAVRDLFNSRKIDVICLCETWHQNSDAVPIRHLRTYGFQVLERACPILAEAATSSRYFINYSGLAVVSRSGLNLLRLVAIFRPHLSATVSDYHPGVRRASC